ncbi:serine hydrolase domain-containing protein [Streptomyces sp. ODS28]|uniref:serine hydrolase domain-containing protein n=1 Tax=Streptomyces sp. ODS28 TaxID=3136688 RepID=UPI0031EAF334
MRFRTGLVGAALAAALTTGALAAPAVAGEATASAAQAPAGPARHGHAATQRAMEEAVRDGVPGVTAGAEDARGPWKSAAGIGDLRDGRPRGADDHYRVASVTKTFVATVVLQLDTERRLRLDDTVERWLPGVVRGHGHDGRRITLRQLLNHTSGIYEFLEDKDFRSRFSTREALEKHRYDTATARQLVDVAMQHAPYFPPGTDWHYSNTNYQLLGMVIRKATGHSYAQEIRHRILRPLGLRHTYVPHTDPRMPRPSSRGYTRFSADPDERPYDVTEFNPSSASASGGMISTSADLNRFYSALLRGRLLDARHLAAMKTTVPAEAEHPGARYGLGLIERRLSCGRTVWGHTGGIVGSATEAVTTADGRHSLALNFNGDWADTAHADAMLEAEFCGR